MSAPPDPTTGHPNTPYDVNLPEPRRPAPSVAPSIREKPSTPTPASRPIPQPVKTPFTELR